MAAVVAQVRVSPAYVSVVHGHASGILHPRAGGGRISPLRAGDAVAGDPPRRSTYRDIDGYLVSGSLIGQPTPARRLTTMASYLDVPWKWFRRRCEELALASVDDIAHPRSRLLSTRGLNTAVRYVAYIDSLEGDDLARR